MASNYKLNLQCVLDTTQVKRELQKLRQLQNQILGNNKRQYDMSNLFNTAYIKSTNDDKCENRKKIKYIPTKGNAYEFSDNNGNEFCIEKIVNLYMQKYFQNFSI